jgi:NADP-dependent 3-hydroxy acid dehydrogenase YdfG
LIVGAGPGISASVAARLRAEGVEVGVAARGLKKLRAPAAAIGAIGAHASRSTQPAPGRRRSRFVLGSSVFESGYV